MSNKLPIWLDIVVLPLVNILLAFLVAAVVVAMVGENPLEALKWMVYGAFGYSEALGYTLYYSTNFIFTGLAVAVAFQARLFNIGGEGQAYIGGLGVGLVCLTLDSWLPAWLILPLALVASAGFGAAWAFIPGYLQATRGSHIVITTIMFNFIASALMVYLLVNVLIQPGSMSPESRYFADGVGLWKMDEFLAFFGFDIAGSPLNVSFFLALLCAFGVYLLIWRTTLGYEIRTFGLSPSAARYAGISHKNTTIICVCISGALAGMLGINEITGVNQRLLLDFTAGAGFTGIAVALMGRNHPFGILLAALLFGALTQGGADLAFEMPKLNRDIVVVLQGLIILFSGALAYMFHPLAEKLYLRFSAAKG